MLKPLLHSLVLALTIALTPAVANAASDESCRLGIYLKKLVEDNAYLKTPPRAVNFRSWEDYVEDLAIQSMDFRTNGTLIDLGAGQGYAVRDAIEERAFREAIAIDFTDHSNAHHWDLTRERTRSKIRFEEDSAEATLLRYPGVAEVITDNYGAFTYSPARIHILNSAFRALKPGGIAYFRCPPVSFVKTFEGVVPLEVYLSQKYPEIFSIRKNRDKPFMDPELDPFVSARTVLVMKKPLREASLDLRLEIESHRKWQLPDYPLIEFPWIVFSEK